MLSENDIREFYLQALRLEPKMLISSLVKQIILFDDKIQIQFNSPIKISPDDENRRGFTVSTKVIKFAYKIPHRRDLAKFKFTIEIYI